MNLHLPFFTRKPAHEHTRYVVGTRAELTEAQRRLLTRRRDTRMELEIMAIHLTPEQREAAKSRATQRLMRVVGRAGQ